MFGGANESSGHTQNMFIIKTNDQRMTKSC